MKAIFRLSLCSLLIVASTQVNAALRNYGQLTGEYTRSNLDDDYMGTRHYEVFVRAPAPKGSPASCPEWRIDINLQNMEHKIVPVSDFSAHWNGVFTRRLGYQALPYGSTLAAGQGALDLMRHPGALEAANGFSWQQASLIQGAGVEATAHRLDDLFRNARKIYAFGESFSNAGEACGTRQGLHNIHQNQGSNRTSVGSWQDGAIIIEYDAYQWIVAGYNAQGEPIWTQVKFPFRTALFSKFADQTEFALSTGLNRNFSGSGGWFSGPMIFGPYAADQISFYATAQQLNRYDSHFSMQVRNAAGVVLATSDGPDADGVREFLRTYRAGPVTVEIDTAWGSAYSFEYRYIFE
jgi:hypothetical protein